MNNRPPTKGNTYLPEGGIQLQTLNSNPDPQAQMIESELAFWNQYSSEHHRSDTTETGPREVTALL
jgi:hypothetical protein